MNIKKIEIDWDSLDAVLHLLNQAKSQYFTLLHRNNIIPTRKDRAKQIFEACLDILNTDISEIYKHNNFDEERKYYVYAHLNTRKKILGGKYGVTTFGASLGMTHFPFYIGKGTDNRCENLNRSETHRKMVQTIKASGSEPIVFVIKSNLSESEALQLESKLIDIFGLIPQNGLLSNLDEGMKPQERRKLYETAYLKLRGINSILTESSKVRYLP
jgi:hypothetical protein